MLGQYTGIITALMLSLLGIIFIVSKLRNKPNADDIVYCIKWAIFSGALLTFSTMYMYYEFIV